MDPCSTLKKSCRHLYKVPARAVARVKKLHGCRPPVVGGAKLPRCRHVKLERALQDTLHDSQQASSGSMRKLVQCPRDCTGSSACGG
jgi:hypothetical protein